MEGQEAKINGRYNIFAICNDFRQRIAELNRLKDKMLKESSKKKKKKK